jgi:hypothetical protein
LGLFWGWETGKMDAGKYRPFGKRNYDRGRLGLEVVHR